MSSPRILIHWLLAGAIASAGSCGGSPTKPPPPDPYPDSPRVTCPAAPAPQTSPDGQPVVVQYGTATATGGAPPVSISCTPTSGSLFPVGTNTVRCTATDARQRTDTCTFDVVVTQAPRISVTRFLAFGDSITWGEDGRAIIAGEAVPGAVRPAVQVPISQTYPAVLSSSLKTRYTAQASAIVVANTGCPGEAAADSCPSSGQSAVSRFRGLVSIGAYDAALVMEGSNDIAARDSSKIPAAINALRTMLRDAKGRNVRPFLATVPPMVPGSQRGLAWSLVPELNSQIRSLAVSEGVTLVDVEAGFGGSYQQYIGFDGLHPNEAGYAKIADIFFNILRSSLEVRATGTATSVPFLVPPAAPHIRK